MEPKLKSVLLIDDEAVNNFLHQAVLKRAGVVQQIQAAETVQAALSLLEGLPQSTGPELIFLDLNMPGLTGWDFLDRYPSIKQACQLDSIIIVLSASVNPEDRQRATQLSQVAEFRSKPLTTSAVQEIVSKYFS